MQFCWLATCIFQLGNRLIFFQDEYNNTNILHYFRTREEIEAPFNDNNSLVMKSGLKLISIETHTVNCVYNKTWKEHPADAKAHAKWYIPTLRTWSNHSFYSGKATFLKFSFKITIHYLFWTTSFGLPLLKHQKLLKFSYVVNIGVTFCSRHQK